MKLSNLINNFFKNESDKTKMNKKAMAIVIMFVIGALFIMTPKDTSKKKGYSDTEIDITQYRENEEKRLGKVFSLIKGVTQATLCITYDDCGTIEVLNEEKTVLKKNADKNIQNEGLFETQTERKPVYDGDKNAVIKKRHAPKIKSACIFYKGDESEKTKTRLYSAAKGALGIDICNIEVVLLK